MHVGFDARLIEHSGIGRYIQSLLPRLAARGCDITAWMSPAQCADPRWEYPGVRRVPLEAGIFSIEEQVALPRAAREAGVEVLHVPHVNAPLLPTPPLVVTLHDLIPFHYPEAIAARFGGVYFRLMARLVPRRATRVLCVSDNTRRDLVSLVGAPAERLEVTPLGVEPAFFEPAASDARRSVRERYGLAGRYFLYAGQWKGYKNVDLLLDLMESLKGPEWSDVRLVLVGKEDVRVPMREELARRGLSERVVLTGFVDSEAELIALYQDATAFLFPSRYEGFGLPPLEAMAAGVPVVASDRASIPEVVGNAGMLVSPDRVLEWQGAIQALCADQSLRATNSERGRARAAGFRWDETADRTVAAYRCARGDGS